MALSKLTLAPARTLLRQAARGMARKPIVGGNWKCNPAQASELSALVANINACDTSKCDVYVSPSPLHVGLVHDKFTNGAKVAPQNCNFAGCGAYTGERSADQMAGMGIEWVLLGHSERRGEFGLPTPKESDALLATRLKCARARAARRPRAGPTPRACRVAAGTRSARASPPSCASASRCPCARRGSPRCSSTA